LGCHLTHIQASLVPGNYLEEQLSYKVALTLQQWYRLDRYECATLVRSMEEGKTFCILSTKRLSLSWKEAFTG